MFYSFNNKERVNLLMTSILDNKADIVLLGKLKPSCYICLGGHIDSILHIVPNRAWTRLRCKWITALILEIGGHN